MRCRRAREFMMRRLDGRLGPEAVQTMEAHLATCDTCQAEWRRLSTLDTLFRSSAVMPAPSRLRAGVVRRIERREQARRVVVGSATLALGALTVALLTLLPLALTLFGNLEAVPALLIGGARTVAQLLTLFDTVVRASLILLDQIAVPFAVLSLGSLFIALLLNGVWFATLRRLRVTT